MFEYLPNGIDEEETEKNKEARQINFWASLFLAYRKNRVEL